MECVRWQFREPVPGVVLDEEPAALGQKGFVKDKGDKALVVRPAVGWIAEDDIVGAVLRRKGDEACHILADNAGFFAEAELVCRCRDGAEGAAVLVDEGGFACAEAEGFEPEVAEPGKEVEYAALVDIDAGEQGVEKGFLHPACAGAYGAGSSPQELLPLV